MDLMKTLTDLLAPLVTPDWGALVGLIPGILAILFVVWFALTLRAFATAGPTRRAPPRIEPITPPELHMPGPPAALILVAFGAAALFGGLVIGGVALIGGVVILVATLALWGREAMRDYSHLEAVQMTLPAVVREPPPGVHMPGPSIRPFMGALGVSALFGGLIAGGIVLVVSVLFLTWTLLGWLIDFRAEYAKTEEADRTGHLENIPDRQPADAWSKALRGAVRRGRSRAGRPAAAQDRQRSWRPGSIARCLGRRRSLAAAGHAPGGRPEHRIRREGPDRHGRAAVRDPVRQPGHGHRP